MTRDIQLQRGFWTSIAILMALIVIPESVYSIAKGTIDIFAVLIVALGVLVIVLALLDSIAEKLTSLRLELWRIAAFLVIFLFFGLNQVFAKAPSFSFSAADEAFYVANRIIIGIAMLIVLWQLAKAVRSSSVSAQ